MFRCKSVVGQRSGRCLHPRHAFIVEPLESRFLLTSLLNPIDEWHASDFAKDDKFGRNVAIAGNRAVVGAFQDDDNGNNSGSAYVFKRDSQTSGWSQVAKLTPNDGARNHRFGTKVAIFGDDTNGYTIAVGAPQADSPLGNDRGAVYIFQDNAGAWAQKTKLFASDGGKDDEFGGPIWFGDHGIAIHDTTLVVGARLHDGSDTNTGEVYVYTTATGDWTDWSGTEKKLGSSVPLERDDGFGLSVDIVGGTVAVGAWDTDRDAGNKNATYIFLKDGAGDWNPAARLTRTNGQGGLNVSISEDEQTVVTGGAWVYEQGSGWEDTEAVVNEANPQANSCIVRAAPCKLMPVGDAEFDAGGIRYALSLDIGGGTVVVGAISHPNGGAAYVFEDTGGWAYTAKLMSTDGTGNLGQSIETDGTHAFVADDRDDAEETATGPADQAGSVSVFLLTNPPPTPGITVSPTSGMVTTEAGGTDTFTVVLDTQPAASVTIDLSSSDDTEGVLLDASNNPVALLTLSFDSSNWDEPQTVTVTGVDDSDVDGDVPFTIITSPSVSGDTDYNGLDATDVSVTNLDDDSTVSEMHVGDLDALASPANRGKWNATVTIVVHAADESPDADATVLGSWNAGASGSSSCVTDSSGTCSVTKNNIKKSSSSVTFTVIDVTHATNSYAPGVNHDPDGDSDGSSITIVQPEAFNVAADARAQSATGDILTDQLLGQTVAEAILLWAETGITAQKLRVLDETNVRVGDLDGTLLAGAVPGIVVIDNDAAGYGWITDPTASDDTLFDGVDVLSVLVHEFGHILGFDHDLMGDTLGVGAREVRFLDDVAASSGSWAGIRRAGDVNADGRFDQRDLIAVLQTGKYLSGQSADWTEGDWNHDGFFNQLDIVDVLQRDGYVPLKDVDSVFARLSS